MKYFVQVKKIFANVMVVLSMSFVFATTTIAAEKVMKIATWLPALHLQNSGVFPKYKEMVEKATDGRVSIQLEYGLGHPNAMYDLVEDGVVDASYTYNGYISGRFDQYRFFELPVGEPINVQKASVAMYKTLEKFYEKNGEFPGWEGLHVAGVFFHPAMNIVTPKPVKSFAELKGLKMVVGDRTRGDIAEHYGIVPVDMPAPKVYESFQQGIIDATTFPYEAQVTLRQQEVAPYIMELNLNIGHFAFVISPDFLDSLDTKDKVAIMELSGETFSHMAGGVWHNFNEKIRKSIATDKITKSTELTNQFKQFVKSYNEKKLTEYEKKNPKVRDAYAYYLDLLK